MVLFRNVLIYSGRELQEAVTHKLGQAIPPGGFLCLGGSERLSRRTGASFVDVASGDRIYRRILAGILPGSPAA